jgi:23S rRNA (guanine2445-N2)-methyltransferase / 23S rRNA (guanine2069-N7)-methyltransferase
MEKIFDVQKDYVSIIEGAMNRLNDDGILYFSNNLRGFKIDLASLGQFDVTDITAESVPRDFQQKAHIHRCWEIRKSE